jgi:hypothetical protein
VSPSPAHGGHIAEILHKPSDVNPRWAPPWPTIDPSDWKESSEQIYVNYVEGRLLACAVRILSAWIPSNYLPAKNKLQEQPVIAKLRSLPALSTGMKRSWSAFLGWRPSNCVSYASSRCPPLRLCCRHWRTCPHRTVRSPGHSTLPGAPFLKRGITQFRIPTGKSMRIDQVESEPKQVGIQTASNISGGYITYLIEPAREQGYFAAYSPIDRILHGYVWRRSDFPWLGVWEENHLRQHTPWHGQVLARGMEFGVSPFPPWRIMCRAGTPRDVCHTLLSLGARQNLRLLSSIAPFSAKRRRFQAILLGITGTRFHSCKWRLALGL